MRLEEQLVMLAASHACDCNAPMSAPMLRVAMTEALTAGVGAQTVKFKASRRPILVTSLHAPGASAYPSTGAVKLESSGRNYTGSLGVRASAIVVPGTAPESAAAAADALGSRDCWPAPIVLEKGEELRVRVELDAGNFGANAFVRLWGYETSTEFAAVIRAQGELWAEQLLLEFTGGDTQEGDEVEVDADTYLERLWHEQTIGAGNITRVELRLDNVDEPHVVLRDPEHGLHALAPYPQDPRAFFGMALPRGRKVIVDAQSDGGGTITSRVLLRGSRAYV